MLARGLCLIGLMLCCLPATCRASGKYATFENDRFYDTDRYYTNGIQLSLADVGTHRPHWVRTACRFFACATATLKLNIHDLGQLMYTPTRIQLADPQPLDRPWAGLLYYERGHTLSAPDQMSTTTFTWLVGVTGRASLAEQSQKMVHKVMDIPPPQGWANQIGGSLAFMATVEKRWAIPTLGAEWRNGMQFRTSAYWRATVGNVMTQTGVGMAVALGKNLPHVVGGVDGIQNTITSVSPVDVACLFDWLRCTTFASAEIRAIAYNVFLDGRIGRDDPQVDSRPFVGETAVGMRVDLPRTRSANHGPWFVQVKVTRRSREFRSAAPVHPHTFGTISAGVDW